VLVPFLAAIAVLPIGGVNPGTCVPRAALADIQPQGADMTFESRKTFFRENFAYSRWFVHETDGGEIVWHRQGNRWCTVPYGDTYLDEPALMRLGVPRADARAFLRGAGEYLEAIVKWRHRHERSAQPD